MDDRSRLRCTIAESPSETRNARSRRILNSINGKAIGKMGIKAEAEREDIFWMASRGAEYAVADITVKEVRRNPSAPFTTSTLQQEAARKLGFSAKQTMMIAQNLYENGLITYMRTDSVNLAESALAQAHEVIGREFGADIPASRTAPLCHQEQRRAGSARGHPADRSLASRRSRRHRGPERSAALRSHLETHDRIADERSAVEQTSVDIEAKSDRQSGIAIGKEISDPDTRYPNPIGNFRANGQVVKFDGFIRAYTEGKDDDAADEIEGQLPKLEEGNAFGRGKDRPRPALHRTAPALHRRDARESARGRRHRPAVNLRANAFHHPRTRLCRQRSKRNTRRPRSARS